MHTQITAEGSEIESELPLVPPTPTIRRRPGRPPRSASSTPVPRTPSPHLHSLQSQLSAEKDANRALAEKVTMQEEEMAGLKEELRRKRRNLALSKNGRRITLPIKKKPKQKRMCKASLVGDEAHNWARKKKKKMHDFLEELLSDRFYESKETVLMSYFERHPDMLQDLCERTNDGEVKIALNDKYRKAVEEQWHTRSFAVKTRVAYSDEQYMRLKHMLGGTYNEEADRYDELEVDGVRPPNLASLRVIRDKAADLRKEMHITSYESGASLSLLAKLKATIIARQIQRRVLWLQFAGDAARAGDIQQTALTFRILGVAKKGQANSPFTTYTLLLYEGDDSYSALSSYTERLLQEMHELSKNGLLVDGQQHTFIFFGGGDLKYVNAIMGLATCAHTYPCPYCMETKDGLFLFEPKDRKTPRTVQGAKMLAHMAKEGKCPGCKVDLADEAAVQAKVPQNENQRKAYQIEHKGQRPHTAPLLPIETKRMPPCILHVMLRLVDHLFTQTIRLHIGDDEEKEANIKAVLADLGIDIKPEKKIRQTKKDLTQKKLKKLSFHGRACKSLLNKSKKATSQLNGYRRIISAMHYPTQGEMTAKVATELWESLEDLIDVLADECDEEGDMYDPEKQQERDEHADKARQAAIKYVQLVEHAFGADSVTLYMHVCTMHVPTFIKALGSLSRWSMQALEHCHSLRKQNRTRACNHKKAGTKGRGGSTTTICYMATELTKQESLQRAHTDVAERTKKHHCSGAI